MQRFRDAKATSRKSVTTLAEIGCRNSWLFRRMVARGVFIDLGEGRFYMDENAAQRFVQLRRQRMLAFLAAAILLFLVWMICS